MKIPVTRAQLERDEDLELQEEIFYCDYMDETLEDAMARSRELHEDMMQALAEDELGWLDDEYFWGNFQPLVLSEFDLTGVPGGGGSCRPMIDKANPQLQAARRRITRVDVMAELRHPMTIGLCAYGVVLLALCARLIAAIWSPAATPDWKVVLVLMTPMIALMLWPFKRVSASKGTIMLETGIVEQETPEEAPKQASVKGGKRKGSR